MDLSTGKFLPAILGALCLIAAAALADFDLEVPIAADAAPGPSLFKALVLDSDTRHGFAYASGVAAFAGRLKTGDLGVRATELDLEGLRVMGIRAARITEMFIAYAFEGTRGGPSRICVVQNEFGVLSPVRWISDDSVEDAAAPSVAAGWGGFLVAYSSRALDPLGEPVGLPAIRIYSQMEGGTSDTGLSGTEPRLATAWPEADRPLHHLVFEGTAGRLHYGQSADGRTFSTAPIGTFEVLRGSLDLKADSGGNLHLAFVSGGKLFYSRTSGTAFPPPVVVQESIQAVSMDLKPDGSASIALGRPDGIALLSGGPAGFSVERVLSGASRYREPFLLVDRWGYPNLLYSRETGGIFYTNGDPPPRSSFSADVTSGKVPLSVCFQDASSNPVVSVLFDFGDGTRETVTAGGSLTHTYGTEGSFTVTATASGPGGKSESKRFISVGPADYSLRIPKIRVFPGEKGVVVPILGTFALTVMGYQTGGSVDSTILAITGISLSGTAAGLLRPEFVAAYWAPEDVPEPGDFFAGVIFDYVPPFTGFGLPPGKEASLAFLTLDVSPGAQPGIITRIALRTVSTEYGWHNTFAVLTGEGIRVEDPYLYEGIVEIVPEGPVFLRGDCDLNKGLEITDAIAVLSYLFLGGKTPPLLDACDADDSGVLDVSDGIRVLAFLFLGGAPPPYPYPAPGLDPTDDGLR